MTRCNSRKVLEGILFCFIVVFMEALFYRNVIFNGACFGDLGDGRLTNFFAEHWFRFFSGKDTFCELAELYPAKNTIALSDMLLGFGLIHSLFRFVGFNLYASYKYTLMIMHLFCIFSMYVLLRKKLHIVFFWSLFGVLAFSYYPAFSILACMHTQLYGVCILPLLLILFIDIYENISNRKKRNMLCISLICCYALLLYTSWYIAFFVALFCFVFVIVFSLKLKHNGQSIIIFIRAFVNLFKFDLILLVLFFAFLLMPFVMIYLPIFKEYGGFSWKEVFFYIPELADVFNVGSDNLIFGKVVQFAGMGDSIEKWTGMSCVLFFVFVCASVFFLRKRNDKNNACLLVIQAFVITIILSFLLAVRLRSTGISLWYFIWRFVPGAKSIRALGRFFFFLGFPVSIIASLYGNACFYGDNNKNRKVSVALSLIFLVGVVLFNIQQYGVYSGWNMKTQRDWIASISNPPSDCESFFIINSVKSEKPDWSYQMDAFEIATAKNVPTLNGYSGKSPKGWNRLAPISNENYISAVTELIQIYNLKNVYSFDVATKKWEKYW